VEKTAITTIQTDNNQMVAVLSSLLIQFKKGTEFRCIGLLEPNRFGEFLFDNDKEGTLARLKKHHELYFDNKAATTGIPKTQLMRDEQFVWSDAKTYDGGNRNAPGPSKPRNRAPQFQGNARGQPKFAKGGGGRQKFRNNGPKNGRGNNNPKNNQQWFENAQEQPNTSGQAPNRGNPRNNKRPWSGGRGNKQQ
jgi:hypothetical protein